jgi:hypothetical protein
VEQSICEDSAASQAEKNPKLANNYGRFYDIFIGHPSARPLRWVLTSVHDLFAVSLLRDPDAGLDWHVGHYPLEQACDPNVGVFKSDEPTAILTRCRGFRVSTLISSPRRNQSRSVLSM